MSSVLCHLWLISDPRPLTPDYCPLTTLLCPLLPRSAKCQRQLVKRVESRPGMPNYAMGGPLFARFGICCRSQLTEKRPGATQVTLLTEDKDRLAQERELPRSS